MKLDMRMRERRERSHCNDIRMGHRRMEFDLRWEEKEREGREEESTMEVGGAGLLLSKKWQSPHLMTVQLIPGQR